MNQRYQEVSRKVVVQMLPDQWKTISLHMLVVKRLGKSQNSPLVDLIAMVFRVVSQSMLLPSRPIYLVKCLVFESCHAQQKSAIDPWQSA